VPHSAEETERARYTPEKGEAICAFIETGRTLSKLLQRDTEKRWPTRRAIELWRKAFPEFDVEYRAARQVGYDARLERLGPIASGQIAEGEPIEFSTGDVGRDKLVIDTEMKTLAMLDPARFGSKVGVEHNVGATLENLILASMAEPKEPE